MTSDIIIEPSIEKGEKPIPPYGLLCINPGDAFFAKKCVGKNNLQEQFLFNSYLAQTTSNNKRNYFIAGPAIGAPMAVLALEKLIALGAQNIIVFGWCGSLEKSLAIGDTFLPTWGKSEEGTSQHYPLTDHPHSAEELRNDLKAMLTHENIQLTQGPIWTTDAPYRETKSQVLSHNRQGILAVDMEFTALSTVALFRNINLAAIMLVSDELFHEKWHPGFKSKIFKKKRNTLITAILNWLADK